MTSKLKQNDTVLQLFEGLEYAVLPLLLYIIKSFKCAPNYEVLCCDIAIISTMSIHIHSSPLA